MINVIQFYDELSDTDYSRQIENRGVNVPALVPTIQDGKLMPFQCKLGDYLGDNFAYTLSVISVCNGVLKDITANITLVKKQIGSNNYLFNLSEQEVSRIDAGLFYLRINAVDTLDTVEVVKYSTIILNQEITQPLKLTYYSANQISEQSQGGETNSTFYQTGFKNVATFRASMEQSESELNEEVKIRDLIELPVQSTLIDQVSFKILTTDDVRNALLKIAIHEFSIFAFQGRTYTANKPCVVSSSYLQDQNLHEVTITVPYNLHLFRESTINDTVTDLDELGDFNDDFNDDFNNL